MKRRKLLAVFMSIVMIAAMAGCKSNTEATKTDTASTAVTDKEENAEEQSGKSTAQKENSGDVVTLDVLTWESDECNKAIQEAFDTVFSVKHPNIKVKVLDGSFTDYSSEVRSMMIAGEAPDVFQIGNDQAISFYQDGLTMDWTDRAKADTEFTKGFYSGATDSWIINGSVIGFPSLVNVYGIFYNKDILKAAGLEEPKPGWTYDDFFRYAQTLKDPANNKYGAYFFELDAFHASVISQSNGGAPFVNTIANPTKITVDDEFLKTVDKLAGYVADGTLPPTTYSNNDVLSMFENGEIGMLAYGQWEIDSLLRNNSKINWGYVSNPVGTTGVQCTMFDPVGWVTPKTTEHPEEVWELIKFMSSDMYQSVLKATPVAASAYIEPSQSFFDVVSKNGHEEATNAVKTMMSADTKCAGKFLASWCEDAKKVWNEPYNNIIDGVSGTSADLVKLAEKLNQLIADNQ